ncbi:putative response regulatory protein Rv3143 [Demequina sediminis]|uniref:Response regulatory protein Rv3143 n=2 Tax=Demequina sediminis TaxID=1930058 RepID=A0ABP9WD47_9MICO
MGAMSDVVKHESGDVSVRPARILLYSDDRNVREKVRFAVGPTTHGRPIEWVEAATHAAVTAQLDSTTFDLVILDGEAAKVGGMGIARQMRHELYVCPPILLLVGRPGDAWLATWSEADAAVAHPLDPFAVRDAVDAFFVPADADA